MPFRCFLLCIVTFYASAVAAKPATDTLWTFTTGGKIFSTPAHWGDTLYAGSTDSCLYAVSASEGRLLWKYKTGGPIQSEPLATREAVFVYSSDGHLQRVNRSNGKREWLVFLSREAAIDTWDYYRSAPVIKDNMLLMGCGNGEIYALSAANGQKIWTFRAGDPVHSKGLVDGNSFYVGSFGGKLYALNLRNGRLQWMFKAIGNRYFREGAFQQPPVLQDSVLYIGSRDYNLYAVHARQGHGIWNYREKDSWFIATPLVYEGRVYTGTSDSHRFVAFHAESGEPLWSHPLNMRVYGQALAVDSVVYFGCFNGHLYGLHYRSGEKQLDFTTIGSRQHSTEVYDAEGHFRSDFQLYGPDGDAAEAKILSLGAITAKPLLLNGRLYFGSTDGRVYAMPLQ